MECFILTVYSDVLHKEVTVGGRFDFLLDSVQRA